MLSVIFILAATLTLLPAVLGKLGPRVDKLSLPWVHSGEHRSPRFAAWGERLWRRPYALRRRSPSSSSLALALPVLGLKTGMPSIKVVPTSDGSRVGYTQVQQAFGSGAPGALQIATTQADAAEVAAVAKADPGIAQVMPPCPAPTARRSCRRCRTPTRRRRPSARRSTGCGPRCRAGALVGGAVAENHDLEHDAVGQDAAGHRRRARARVPAAARRAAGADHRGGRRADEPAGHRRRVRRRPADLPGGPPLAACSASSRRASSTPGGRCSSSR